VHQRLTYVLVDEEGYVMDDNRLTCGMTSKKKKKKRRSSLSTHSQRERDPFQQTCSQVFKVETTKQQQTTTAALNVNKRSLANHQPT